MSEYEFGAKSVLASYTLEEPQPPRELTEEERRMVSENIQQNVTELVSAHPETTFYLFFPPYSICYWDMAKNDGTLDSQIDAEQMVIEELIKYPNVKLYSFCNNAELVCNLEHYRDQAHYDEWVNSQILKSYIFVSLFFPLALAGYYILNHFQLYRAAGIFLTGMSLWFYGYFNPSYLLIICGSIAVNYLISQFMMLAKQEYLRKISLALGICGNIAVIFYFKYFNFFLEHVNSVFGKSFELKNIVLPLGISFFTFQQISYLVDSYRGKTKGYSFDEYALFVSFFPQLIAGPIVLHNEMIPQFRKQEKRKFIPKNF